MAIEATHYQEAREAFKADPIIEDMAATVTLAKLVHYGDVHADGSPTSNLMGMVWDEYLRRGGQLTGHIGAPAEALVMLLKEREGA